MEENRTKKKCKAFVGRAKQRYSKNREEKLSPTLHLAAAAEAGALVS
ncbi:putative folate carrier protein [Corchorus capsularis]|uniref:Putative folate carrier protein n=1 Tax=Corchorus capsularis TaxID=210143 RepID=A0A1R3GFX5_COCAP|nr:putative folate carrier protein [Corchorus capsularis]